MAKDKKRGFFSWLGFGRDESSPESEAAPAQEEEALTQTGSEKSSPENDEAATDGVHHSATIGEAEAEKQHDAALLSLQQEKTRPVAETEAGEDVKPDAEPEIKPEAGEDVKPDAEPEIKPEAREDVKPDAEPEIKPEAGADVKPDAEPEIKPEAGADAEQRPDSVAPEQVVPPAPEASDADETAVQPVATEQQRPTKEGFFARLKRSLVKTRQNLGSGFISLFRGKKIDDDLFEELEEQLLIADVGVDTTRRIIDHLTHQASRKELRDAEALYGLLKAEMTEILSAVDKPLDVAGHTPFVILMVGVNGVGKTTTIGKLARQYQAEGKSVMLAAGDTFRAAAVEQLQVWGERNAIPVIAQHTGADSASVIFDAMQAAKARGVDVLIADTAGRLQNKSHLMEELKKISRVMKKLDESAPHEIMLTIDASTGQNAISQTKLFHDAVGLTGITLTKLDGTAKGGVIFSVADQFGIPIRYIGVGEGIEDLRPFKADDFIEALFARED